MSGMTNMENTRLAEFLDNQAEMTVMRHFLGFPIPDAPSMLEDVIFVGIDTEWWEKYPEPLTELGFAELSAKSILETAIGAHAENIITKIRTTHARIMPYAHLLNKFPGAGNPEKFNFGHTVFVSLEEAGQVLVNMFRRPCNGSQGGLRPVIFVGHAVDKDFEKLKQYLGIDLLQLGTIVKIIDTQVLAKRARIFPPKGFNISLKHLVEHFKIKPDNLHTAGNDAAHTMMAAVLTAVNQEIFPPNPAYNRDINHVVNRIMQIGKALPPPSWGRVLFCTRCDRKNHVREQCQDKHLFCEYCANSPAQKTRARARTHKASKCLFATATALVPAVEDPMVE